ncbi:hypothetical protein PR048_012005 [Dryococelus australis]|uniref:Uncharacterized protein n=1 Tax=Dryococelus australis TaxID=614101 RepID=A0ABQ9HNQ7_9NEOP|nr:hypothetical protein PR048_012005 [Dryococelus australis]
MQQIRITGKERALIVKEIKREHFFSYSKLLKGHLLNHKWYNDGSSVNWRCILWLLYYKNMPMYVSTKLLLNAIPVLQPTLTYTGPNPISVEKKKDLLELLPFIFPLFHEVYKNLRRKDYDHNVLSDVFDDESD